MPPAPLRGTPQGAALAGWRSQTGGALVARRTLRSCALLNG